MAVRRKGTCANTAYALRMSWAFSSILTRWSLWTEHSSDTESRYAVIGLAAPGLLYVVFTELEPGVIRILHARRADKRMVRIYEGEQE